MCLCYIYGLKWALYCMLPLFSCIKRECRLPGLDLANPPWWYIPDEWKAPLLLRTWFIIPASIRHISFFLGTPPLTFIWKLSRRSEQTVKGSMTELLGVGWGWGGNGWKSTQGIFWIFSCIPTCRYPVIFLSPGIVFDNFPVFVETYNKRLSVLLEELWGICETYKSQFCTFKSSRGHSQCGWWPPVAHRWRWLRVQVTNTSSIEAVLHFCCLWPLAI